MTRHTQHGTKPGTEGVTQLPLDVSVIPAALLCDYYPVPCYRSCYLKKLQCSTAGDAAAAAAAIAKHWVRIVQAMPQDSQTEISKLSELAL